MQLVMFDLDGTLCASYDADNICFCRAIEDTMGFTGMSPDWTTYQHATDPGIAHEAAVKHLGRAPTQKEMKQINTRLIVLMEEHAKEDPGGFHPVAGAVAMTRALMERNNTVVAIATGAWRSSALLKLGWGEFDVDRLPLATGDDAMDRVGIMRAAEERTAGACGVASFSTKVYVGDGPWDLRASSSLGYGFVGVAEGAAASRLGDAGACRIVPDFSDLAAFLTLLDEALRENGS